MTDYHFKICENTPYETASLSALRPYLWFSLRRSEQQRGAAGGEGPERQHELEQRRRRPGGDQHRHREEEGLWDAIAALQELPVCPLAATAAAGGSETLRPRKTLNLEQLRVRRRLRRLGLRQDVSSSAVA